MDDETSSAGAAALTAAVLEEESKREAEQAQRDEVVFADDLLPGVGAAEMPLKEGLAKGGVATFGVLATLNALDELEAAALQILGPEIAESLDVSDGTLVFIASASVLFFILGAMPMGWLSDRYKRTPIVGFASLAFSAFAFLSGLAVNALMLFVTRFFVGISKSNTIPVHSSMLADAYPIGVRGRIFSLNATANRFANAISPVLAGLVAWIVGGEAGWRWAFFILSVPIAIFAFAAFRLPEPQRGRWEKEDVLGEAVDDEAPPLISVENAFARLWQIRTLRSAIYGFSGVTFGLIPMGSVQSFFLRDEFDLSPLRRGAVVTAMAVGAIVVMPIVGQRFDTLFRRNPTLCFERIALALLPLAVIVPIQFSMPNVYLFIAVGIFTQILLGSVFAMTQPVIQAVVPYRLRGLGSALVTIVIFLLGGLIGSLAAAFLTDATSPRVTVITLIIPAMAIGSLMMYKGAKELKRDMSLVVAELQEEQSERDRRSEQPDDIPALQVHNVDFSYGKVQVLFDLSFEVEKGETLALLGTNGAGKSTILRAITGLGTPSRGTIRMHGRNITFGSPEQRAAAGIQMLPGGKGTFQGMTIGDNLRMGAYAYRRDHDDVERRINRVLEMFPSLADRLGDRAGDLSGGQQQMLALARIMLHEPEILIIDELSLGLAPTVVQDLLETIDGLKQAGQTMVIVEQSLNVALAIADRAVFLEKGQVRFEGPAQELAERDDLARAVFLGSEGG